MLYSSDALKIKFDFIVCNLPYLATDEILDIATDGGSEGFVIPKKIFDSAINNLKKNGKFIFVTSLSLIHISEPTRPY